MYKRVHKDGRILQIANADVTDCFIGSTTKPLIRRMCDLRRLYKNYKNYNS